MKFFINLINKKWLNFLIKRLKDFLLNKKDKYKNIKIRLYLNFIMYFLSFKIFYILRLYKNSIFKYILTKY